MVKWRLSQETKDRIRVAMTGKTVSPETRRKISRTMKRRAERIRQLEAAAAATNA